jgi:hypothetical protein
MSTQTNDQATQTTTVQRNKKVSLLGEASAVGVHSLRAVGNVARALEHSTGVLADKAERYREQVSIADAIEHNQLMAELNQQAKELGLDNLA